MIVSVAEVRSICGALLDHLEAKSGNEINLDKDYYWDIPAAVRYDPYVEPRELTMGQLTDDLAEVRKVASGESPQLCYQLVWLAAVLRALGEIGD